MLFNDNKLRQFFDEEDMESIKSIFSYTVEALQKDTFKYEDWIAITYLKSILGYIPKDTSIKHVIVDEAQDYTALQYEIFKTILPDASMTILGDINQAINHHMNVGKYESISEVYSERDTTEVNLTKSYRSTKEITDYCKELLINPTDIEYLNRPGKKPKLIKSDNKKDMMKEVTKNIDELKNNGYKSIAIICKTAQQANEYYNYLSDEIEVKLITKEDIEYVEGIVMLPSYLAKGLEFDAVLLCIDGERDYVFEDERRLLYTSCTRALHVLNIHYFNKMPSLISEINTQLYEI